MSAGRRSRRGVPVSGSSQGQGQRGSSSRSQNKRQKLQEQSQNTQTAGFFDFPIVTWTQHEEEEMSRKIKFYQDKFTLSCDLNQHRRTNPEEEDLLTSTLLRYILFHTTKEPGIPITRTKISEIIKEALPAGGAQRGFLSTHVIARVQAELAEKMGMELKQIVQDKFVLQSLLPRSILREVVNGDKNDGMHGFVLLVLAIIRLSNDKIESDDLWNKLGKFDVYKDEQIEGVGVVGASAIQLMIKKRYLKEEKQQSSDGYVHVYEFGEQIQSQDFDLQNNEGGIQSAEFTVEEVDEFIDSILLRGHGNTQIQVVDSGGVNETENMDMINEDDEDADDDLD